MTTDFTAQDGKPARPSRPSRAEISKLQAELAEARHIIRDTLWMARRYADGRQSYATSMYNAAARRALAAGIVQRTDREPMYAHDQMGHQCAGLTAEEQAEAAAWARGERSAPPAVSQPVEVDHR